MFPDHASAGPYAIGYDANAENIDWFLSAFGRDSKLYRTKCKGEGNVSCFNCGDPRHYARARHNPTKEIVIHALGGEGEGCGERSGGWFHCGRLAHIARDCRRNGKREKGSIKRVLIRQLWSAVQASHSCSNAIVFPREHMSTGTQARNS